MSDLLSAVKTVFILNLTAWVHTLTQTHKNTLVQACLVKRKIPQLSEDLSFSRTPPPRLQCHPNQGHLPHLHPLQPACPCSPAFVTLGLSTLPLYFKTGRAVCQEGQKDKLLWAALCTARATRRGPTSVCKTTLAGLFTAEAHFGGGGAGEAGKLAGREGRRGGLLPSRESEFLLSHSPIWLAVVKTIAWHLLSLCRWSPRYESALRAASGGESGGPVISCTANIRILYRDTLFLMLGKRFGVASSLTFLVVLCSIADVHNFYLHCLVAHWDKLTNKGMSVSCFSRVDLQKTLCWCLKLRETSSSTCHSSPFDIPHLVCSPSVTETNSNHRHLHLFPTPLLPGLSSPWRRSWRAAWLPWIGFLSWPCRRPSARRTPRMPMGQAWARRVPYWILTPRWTRRRCSSTRTASRPTATPASSRLPSTARQRRRWHWARSTSGSVITFPTTGRRAVAGRWETDTSGLQFKLMRHIYYHRDDASCILVIVGLVT